jgi:sugar phosphate isomerase/epimerase
MKCYEDLHVQLRTGYNTNGLAHHDLIAALELLSDIGYRSVAISIDHNVLNPWGDGHSQQLDQVSRFLADSGMRSVVETGARFLLDPRTKHEPTLMTADANARAKRVEFLCRAIDIAAELSSDCVSLWSGILHETLPVAAARDRLVAGLEPVLGHAEQRGVRLGFEPEPSMFIDTMDSFAGLSNRIGSDHLGLTLDIGHLHCLGETPIPPIIHRWKDQLINIHIEDMRLGVHEHLMFGEGEIEFEPIMQALAEVGYSGGLHVELSRHSHDGPGVAQRAYDFLNSLLS